MATGSAARCTAYTGPHGSLHQTNVLITFISSSAGWIYPIDRFFGRALYEYYYDVDFTDWRSDCDGQEEIHQRNRILYESYCHLVGSLMINACRDYNIEATEIVRMIALVETKPELLGCISQCHFNYIRGVYGIDHFGYIMMRYCNDYKLTCCKDEMKIVEANPSIDQMPNERHYLMYLLDIIESIGENYLRTEEILSGRCLPVVEEIKVGPFVSSCGISLSDPLQHHEYKSTISALQELNKQAKLTAYRLRQLDTMVEETSKENIPSDLLDVIAALTRATTLDGDPSPTISPPKHQLTKRTLSARLSNEEVLVDSTPAKRGSFQKDTLLAPPPSPKSTSHSPANSFQSSLSLKSKSRSPAESSQSSTETVSVYFKEVTGISPQLAGELTQPSFQPIQYKASETLPDSERYREQYLLSEYDRRLELHIAYNAMKFMIWNVSENMVQLKSVIDNQAMFEEMWPSPRSKNEPGSIFRKVYTNIFIDQEEGAELFQEAQSLIEQIQHTLYALKSKKLDLLS